MAVTARPARRSQRKSETNLLEPYRKNEREQSLTRRLLPISERSAEFRLEG